jgi:hypothetical protein
VPYKGIFENAAPPNRSSMSTLATNTYAKQMQIYDDHKYIVLNLVNRVFKKIHESSNKPLEWTGPQNLLAATPQAPGLPLRGSVRRIHHPPPPKGD